jgi:signal transduction histidine kinase
MGTTIAIIVIFGILLMILETFVPGMVTGIAGALCVLAGMILVLFAEDFAHWPGWLRALAATLAGCVAAVVGTAAWIVLLRRQVRVRSRQLAAEIRSRDHAAIEFEATLRERNRLAANLHDTLLQTLGGIGYQLDACEGSRASDESESKLHFDIARRMVNHATGELHNSVWAMRSLPIREQTFPEAIRTLCDRVVEGHAATVSVVATGEFADTPEFVAGNLLLIVQEAVLNSLRHGRAGHIDVRVVDRPEVQVIEAEVRDYGRGFDQALRPGVEQGHFGIQGMRERAERLGGTLVIESEPGRGTVVRLTVRRHEMDCELTKAGPNP